MNTLTFKTDTAAAMKKLENAIKRLGATDFDHGSATSRDDASAYVKFSYKGNPYRFEYSRSRAEYFGIRIPQQKDILVMLVNGIVDLARLADRGIFDFGQLISGFKQLEFIETPKWAVFMGFNSRPRNMQEVRSRYNDLVKGSMNPNTNRDDFEQLQKYMEIAEQYYGVKR